MHMNIELFTYVMFYSSVYGYMNVSMSSATNVVYVLSIMEVFTPP